MQNKNNISENERNSNEFLNKIKKKNPFSTPKNYFEELHQVINNKKLENKYLKNYFDILSYRILAPILTVLLVTILYFSIQPKETKAEPELEQLSEFIINEKVYEFDEEMIFEVYAETTLNNKEQTTDDEVIDYLIENNISINSIFEEL